jgi:hypothetical protein
MNFKRARWLAVVIFLTGLNVFQGCKRDSGAKTPAATQPVPQVAADPPPNPAAVLAHLQRLINQGANCVELFAERTGQLDPAGKRELLTRLTAAWSEVRVNRIDAADHAQWSAMKPSRGVNVYVPEVADRLTLARVLVFDKPAVTMICIMDDPKLSGFRYVIDSAAVANWTDEFSRKEGKH